MRFWIPLLPIGLFLSQANANQDEINFHKAWTDAVAEDSYFAKFLERDASDIPPFADWIANKATEDNSEIQEVVQSEDVAEEKAKPLRPPIPKPMRRPNPAWLTLLEYLKNAGGIAEAEVTELIGVDVFDAESLVTREELIVLFRRLIRILNRVLRNYNTGGEVACNNAGTSVVVNNRAGGDGGIEYIPVQIPLDTTIDIATQPGEIIIDDEIIINSQPQRPWRYPPPGETVEIIDINTQPPPRPWRYPRPGETIEIDINTGSGNDEIIITDDDRVFPRPFPRPYPPPIFYPPPPPYWGPYGPYGIPGGIFGTPEYRPAHHHKRRETTEEST